MCLKWLKPYISADFIAMLEKSYMRVAKHFRENQQKVVRKKLVVLALSDDCP